MRKNSMKRIFIFLIILGLILIPISLSKYKTTYSSTIHLSVIKPVFTVTFNANGGTGTMTDQEIIIDTDTNLKPNEYTRQDYFFTGWNTQADGEGTDYADEASVRNLAAQNSSITLYAQWEEITGVAEINGNYYDTLAEAIAACPGDSDNAATTTTTIRLLCDVQENVKVTKGKNIILNLDTHTLTNANESQALIENTGTLVVRNGTLTKAVIQQHALINNTGGAHLEIIDATLTARGTNKSQAIYNYGATLTVSGNSIISAESTNRATITNQNSGTVIIKSGTIISASQSAIRSENGTATIGTQGTPADNTTPVLQGKLYGLDNSGGTTYFYDGICKGENKGINKTIPASNIETGCSIVTGTEGNYKTAYLAPNNTITFKYNDGTTDEEIIYRDTGATLGTLPEPSKEGFSFDGWYTESEEGTQVTESTIVSGDATYFGHWTEEMRVDFNANGGTVDEEIRYVLDGEELGELPVPEYPEHIFDGWFTDPNEGTQVTESTVVTANMTLYAHWTGKKRVDFNANGGTVDEETRYIDNGEELGEPPVPEYANHRFDGWFTDPSEGTQVTGSTIVTTDMTLYAHWTEIYTIIFDPNGGKLASEERKRDVVHNEPVGTLPTPTRTSSTFLGWFTERTGGTQVSASIVENSNKTYYAHWNGPDVASIDGVTYPTLQDALRDVPTDNTLTTVYLLQNSTEAVEVIPNQTVVLNLQGNTLNNDGTKRLSSIIGTDNRSIVIQNGGTLTITNGTVTEVTSSANPQSTINNTGNLIIDSATVSNTGIRQAIYNDGGHLEITGTSYIEATNLPTDNNRGAIHNLGNGTVVITGGTVVAEKETAIKIANGTVTIGTNDGTISTTSPVLIGQRYGINNSGTLNFYDGIVRVPTGNTAINGKIANTPNGYTVVTDNGATYNEAYLSTVIPIPTANTGLVYDRTKKTGVPSDNKVYTITGSTATAAGTHTATASLKYPSISTWSDGTTTDKTITYTIDKATVTPVATADNKIYDGTTVGTGTISLTGVISGDTVTATATSYTFASPDVGTGITVTASGITISGVSAGNYELSTTTAETTADITEDLNNVQSMQNAPNKSMGVESDKNITEPIYDKGTNIDKTTNITENVIEDDDTEKVNKESP